MVTRRTPSKAASAKKRTTSPRAVKTPPRTFWDDLADIGKSVPAKDLAFLPTDLAARFDDYLESGFFDK